MVAFAGSASCVTHVWWFLWASDHGSSVGRAIMVSSKLIGGLGLKPGEPPMPYQFSFGDLALSANPPFSDKVKPNQILSVNTLLSYYENISKAQRI